MKHIKLVYLRVRMEALYWLGHNMSRADIGFGRDIVGQAYVKAFFEWEQATASAV